MSRETWPAVFSCQHCLTEVTLPVHHPMAPRSWTCAACRLRAKGRPSPRGRGLTGLVWWLGDQLVDDLGDDARAPFRDRLSEPLAPILAAATERLTPREELAELAVDVVSRVLRAVRDLDGTPLSEGGRRLHTWAMAGDAAALHAHWRPRVGKEWHMEEDLGAMLEGPPSAYERGYGRWFGHVMAFLFDAEGGLYRLVDMSWWEGGWQGPPRPGHPEDEGGSA